MAQCAKCGWQVDEDARECPRCGVVLAKARPRTGAPAVPQPPSRLPLTDPSRERQRLRGLAVGSVLAPVGVMVARAAAISGGLGADRPPSPAASLGVAFATLVIYAIGLAVGIHVLRHVRRFGRTGLFAPALAGVLLNGLLLVILLAVGGRSFRAATRAASRPSATAEDGLATVAHLITLTDVFDGRVRVQLACRPRKLAADRESIAPGVIQKALCQGYGAETVLLLYDLPEGGKVDLPALTTSLLGELRAPLVERGVKGYRPISGPEANFAPGQRRIEIDFEDGGVAMKALGRAVSDGEDAAFVLTTFRDGSEPGASLAQLARSSLALAR